MGLLTFSINVTLDGCVDHQEGIADDETHAFFTRLMFYTQHAGRGRKLVLLVGDCKNKPSLGEAGRDRRFKGFRTLK